MSLRIGREKRGQRLRTELTTGRVWSLGHFRTGPERKAKNCMPKICQQRTDITKGIRRQGPGSGALGLGDRVFRPWLQVGDSWRA